MIIDMNRRGFTVVELVIVIFIMGALLILGVANLRGSQISARDSERKTDIETIALHLENYYTSASTGQYPSTSLVSNITTIKTALPDIDTASITAPGLTDWSQTFIASTNVGSTNIQTTTGVLPQPTTNQYVYQPIKNDGTVCAGSDVCLKFNLYYRLEQLTTATADCPDTATRICMVTSKNQ